MSKNVKMTATFGKSHKGGGGGFNDSFDRDSIDFGFGNQDLSMDFKRDFKASGGQPPYNQDF